jgi:LPS sulfotransferase NodH
MQAGKNIVFCATQRTGSTMIFDDFRNIMGYPERDAEMLFRMIIREETIEPWEAIWATICKRCNVGGHIMNKVMFHYVPALSRFMSGEPIGPRQPVLEFKPELFDAFHAFFREAIWVYIERHDVFAQAVSMYLAESTSLWEIRLRKPHPERRAVEYDRAALHSRLRNFLIERTQWQRFFKYYGIDPICIEYEDAVARYPHYLDSLVIRTGLRPLETVPERRMLKVGTDLNDTFAARLRDEYLADISSRGLVHG